jgi:hypothetical protein
MGFSFSSVKNKLTDKGKCKKPKVTKKNRFLRDRGVRFFIILSPILNLIAWFLAIVKLAPLPEPVILHYNSYFGVDLEGSGEKTLFLPGAGLFVLILNFFLSFVFKKKDILITKIILATSFLFNAIIIIALLALISVNKF